MPQHLVIRVRPGEGAGDTPRDIGVGDEYWMVEAFDARSSGERLGYATVKRNPGMALTSLDYIEVTASARRQRIATMLVQEAMKRWPDLSISEAFSSDGRHFLRSLSAEQP